MVSVSIVLVMGSCLHLVAAVAVLASIVSGAQAEPSANKTGSKQEFWNHLVIILLYFQGHFLCSPLSSSQMLDVLDQAHLLHTGPATLPLSVRQQEGRQMEIVLLALEFAVSKNILKC